MKNKLAFAIALTFGTLFVARMSAQSPIDSMCAARPLSPQMVQICRQAQQADQQAREALQKFRQQYSPKPRTMQEAIEMAGGADHPVRWVRGSDGQLYAISNDAPNTYISPGVPSGGGDNSQNLPPSNQPQ
jgi:hypothetical protein